MRAIVTQVLVPALIGSSTGVCVAPMMAAGPLVVGLAQVLMGERAVSDAQHDRR